MSQKHTEEQPGVQPTRRTKKTSENLEEVPKTTSQGGVVAKDPTGHRGIMLSPDCLVPVQEVASLLGISIRFVWRLVARGDLKQPVRLGRSRKWVYLDVLAYIQKLKDDRDRRTG